MKTFKEIINEKIKIIKNVRMKNDADVIMKREDVSYDFDMSSSVVKGNNIIGWKYVDKRGIHVATYNKKSQTLEIF
jgi:hypothetical protein